MTNLTCNGWSNYETACLAQWIANDRPSYERWRDAAARIAAEAPYSADVRQGTWNVADAARNRLADELSTFCHDLAADQPCWFGADLLVAALDRVDWHDLAEDLLEDFVPRDGEEPLVALTLSDARFSLGRIDAAAGYRARLPQGDILAAIARHVRGEWGTLDAHDVRENERALSFGGRLLSVHQSQTGVPFWVVTAADRSVTTVLLSLEE